MSETTQHRITLPIPHAWEVTYGDAVKSRCFKLEQAEAEKAAIALHGTVERLYREQQVLQLLASAPPAKADRSEDGRDAALVARIVGFIRDQACGGSNFNVAAECLADQVEHQFSERGPRWLKEKQ
jgi:hypothetical protein